MAETITQEVEAGALNAIATAISNNATTVEGWIASGEADIQAGLVNLVKSIPSVSGILSLVVGPVETAVEAGIEAYVASLIAKYTPAQIVTLLVAFIQGLATKVA